jgi:hypothetical protein
MRCRGLHKLANTPYLSRVLFPACPVLHRIAFPVVSEWCQYHPIEVEDLPLEDD